MTGSGTQTDPYIISSKADLQNMENDLSAYYELGANIDASGTGAGFTPITDFTGQLDGKDYTITGFFINRTGSNNQALFGQISGNAILKNINMTGVNVTCDGFYVGALVGLVDGSSCTITSCNSAGAVETTHVTLGIIGGLIGFMAGGTVRECYSSCTVLGRDTCGGLIGDLRGGTVSYCYATGTVEWDDGGDLGGGLIGRMRLAAVDGCYATGAVTVADDWGGGFVGYVTSGTIDDCYARGAVTGGDDEHGGFVGKNAGGTIDDCYSTGAATGVASIGGFCGLNAGTITNSFWDTETSSNATSSGGTGKTTAQMKTQATFVDADWDFTDIWGISAELNGGYPYLQWAESLVGELSGVYAVVQTRWHYVDAFGDERYVEGTKVP